MGTFWLFLIPAIACPLFADKIDKAANKRLKILFSAVLLTSVTAVIAFLIVTGE